MPPRYSVRHNDMPFLEVQMLPLQALEFLGPNPGKAADGYGNELVA